MEPTALTHALSALSRHFEDQLERISGRILLDATDYRFSVIRLNEMVAAIYAADIAVSHADPRSGSDLRKLAAEAMAYTVTLRGEIDFLEGIQDDATEEVEEGGAA